MKSKRTLWLAIALGLLYVADATYPDWGSDGYVCRGKTTPIGVYVQPSSEAETKKLVGRHFLKPSLEGCEFPSSNALRNFIERLR